MSRQHSGDSGGIPLGFKGDSDTKWGIQFFLLCLNLRFGGGFGARTVSCYKIKEGKGGWGGWDSFCQGWGVVGSARGTGFVGTLEFYRGTGFVRTLEFYRGTGFVRTLEFYRGTGFVGESL